MQTCPDKSRFPKALARRMNPMIPRRRFLASGLGAAGLAGLGAGAQAQPRASLRGRVAANAAPKSPWDNQWNRFKQRLAAADAGIDLSYFLRAELGNEEIMMYALRRNRVQMCGITLQGLSAVVPELMVLTLPYLFDSQAELDFVYEQHLTEPFRKLFRSNGLELLQWTEVGWTNLYANRPVRLPADVAGLKLRGSPNPSAQGFLSIIGSDPVALGVADLVPALQTGLVQGGLSGVVFHYFISRGYATDYTLTQHAYDTGAVVANAEWFAGATAPQQDALRGAFGTAADTRGEVRGLAESLLSAMEKQGIRVHRLTDDERRIWAETTRPLHAALIARIGGQAQAIYDTVMSGKAAFRALAPSQ